MTDGPTVSVVIVSRGRPNHLRRVLVSFRYLDYPKFEVVVVSPSDPRVDFPEIWAIDRVKYVAFDRPNISAARNAGIAVAAGTFIAFCDDDAVPEPTWLTHLTVPFSDPDVAAAGGFVRGRNGISFQWQARSFDRFGTHSDLKLNGTAPEVFQGGARRGIKTEGTNCAFRRKVLCQLQGFDENFYYYLDETDLNFRLGMAGWKTAIVPLAQVHHGFAASRIRSPSRAPRDLFDIGASSAYFWQKHTPEVDHDFLTENLNDHHRNRLLSFMIEGDLEPYKIKALLSRLQEGLTVGRMRNKAGLPPSLNSAAQPFLPFALDRGKLAPISLCCPAFILAKNAKKSHRCCQIRGQCHRISAVFHFSLSPGILLH